MDVGGQTGPMCVAVINLKGGVGKTTIAALLGRYAAANMNLDGGNEGGPEKRRSLKDIRKEATANGWKLFRNELPHSRGFPKRMRGDYRHPGNSVRFSHFAREFYKRLGLEKKA